MVLDHGIESSLTYIRRRSLGKIEVKGNECLTKCEDLVLLVIGLCCLDWVDITAKAQVIIFRSVRGLYEVKARIHAVLVQ